MTTRLAPSSGANFVEAGTVVARQLYPRITGMQFGILSPEEIEALAPKVICDNTVYAKNLPKLNGPNDPSLGPSDRRVRCSTCQNTWFGCPGHHGVIRLPVPVYHVGFVEDVYKLLQSVCWNCSWPKGDPDDARLKNLAATGQRGIVKFLQVFFMGRGRFKCRNCNVPQPKYALAKVGMLITRTFKPKQLEVIRAMSALLYDAAVRKFTPADALDILRNISDDHCRLAGMDPVKSHPSWMILQNLAVLPPNARPAIMAAEGSKRRGQDDITSQTQDIVKVCRTLRRAILRFKDESLFRQGPSTKPKRPKGQDKPDVARYDDDSTTAGDGDDADDSNFTHALNLKIATSEFTAHSDFLADFREADVAALRFALPSAVLTPSPMQAASIWEQFPLLCEKLQNSVTILYDNSGKYAPQARQRTGGPKKSLLDRLVGKQGRVRGNGVAKRVDLSARTVIIPDASLDVDELGIPSAFAVILTIPEDVNMGNVAKLEHAVRLGHGVMGGASRILHATGEMTQLQYVDAAARRCIALHVGDSVERHLLDGDRVIFNRQPSLHKLSVMVHRIRLIDGLAIADPLAVVEPYNADFDGDEMNLHVLQSMLANAEAVELMAVTRNVMNPQNNEPCLSLVQDVRVGAMLLTRRDTHLSADRMHQCMGAIRYPVPGKEGLPPPAGRSADGTPYWTGKQLVSAIMPSIFIEKRVRGAGPDVGPDDPQERYVVISNGVLLHGTLCKATLGHCTGGIIHRICTSYGQEAACRFLSDFQRIVYTWLPGHGLTMGLADSVIPAGVQAHLRAATSQLDALVAGLTQEALELQPHMTPTEAARVEAYILTILTSNLDYASRLVMNHALDGGNAAGFRAMVDSGSKGNSNNIAQVMAFLGQQVVDGHRIAPSATSNRTLPMFPPGAFSAAARGFIMNSYTTGMEPHEYFNHMQGGREGLVATAVKTAETGYKYRSMAKGQETNVVHWDASVRNAQGYVMEFIAGGDCMDPTKVERVSLDVLRLGDAAVLADMGGDAAAAARVCALRDALRSSLLTPLYRELATKVLLPVNIREEVHRAAYALRSRTTSFAEEATLSTDQEYHAVAHELAERVLAYLPSREAGLSLELAIVYELRPAAMRAAGLNAHTVRHTLAAEIHQRTVEALSQPGESVGIIAAQSIGEPSTQFTLDAFHQAGMVQRRMTAGVPRLKELLHASERISTPSMLIPFRDSTTSKEAADALARSLQFLCVDAVLHSSYVQYDLPGDGVATPLTNMFKDTALMQHAAAMYGPEAAYGGSAPLSPWIIRLVLNRAVLMEHSLSPEEVAKEVAKQLPEYHFLVVYSQPNMPYWVLRIRMVGDTSERACRMLHARVREHVLLGGIDGIRDSRALELKRSVVDSSGAVVTACTYAIDTEGSSLMKVATRDWADWENTVTNDVQEVCRTLGIVAARALLFAELDRVISYDGGYVDPRHIRALTTTMTHRGYIMSMTRHGINRVDYSVLQRASYEEPVDMLLQAALTAERDDLNGMCQAILAGQKVPIGTGTVSIQQDVEAAGTQRNPLASREIMAADQPGNRRKRVRDNVATDGRRSSRPPLEIFRTSTQADVAWQTEAAAVPDRRVQPHSLATMLTGSTITTNMYGEAELGERKSEDQGHGPARNLADTQPYRPSSPSELLGALMKRVKTTM